MKIEILSVVGMSGAGKTMALDYLKEKGMPKVYFGGMLYAEMDRRGIDKTPENQVWFRQALREEKGEDCLAQLAVEDIKKLAEAGQRRILLDGIHYMSEYRTVKRAFPGDMVQVGIIADKEVRYDRLAKRPERPFNKEQAAERDRSEIEAQGIGNVIIMSDYFVMNNGTPEELYEGLEELLRKTEFLD
ncbi:AAA family ATPase [Candidatus Saccharibacteria bacterium]|nr:AAA family ATPase [Candidatus Saccharibacteria bacterium]